MNWRLCLALSLAATGCGLTLVLVFLQRYLVPNASIAEVMYTSCQVDAIQEDQKTRCLQVLITHPVHANQSNRALAYLYVGERSTDPSHCFCEGCEPHRVSSGLEVHWGGGRRLSVGDQVECFYRLSLLSARSPLRLDHADETDQRWLLFHVMFWPTVIFVAGFVCLFLSCIHLMQHHIQDDTMHCFCL